MYSVEVEGIEWDWFASDLAGHIALVSSGGSGQVPHVMLKHEPLIVELMTLAGIRYDAHSWSAAAEFGLFAYDVDANGGPYTRCSSPSSPKVVGDLPERFHALVQKVVVNGYFSSMAAIPCDLFSY